MALTGIPIPAHEHSSIGFFTGVFADIGDEQSIEPVSYTHLDVYKRQVNSFYE